MSDFTSCLFKYIKPFALVTTAMMALACGAASTPDAPLNSAKPDTVASAQNLPPIREHLACLPQEAAIIAAHRGTSKDWDEPENSISALKKLIAGGYLMAEIDIAGLRDDTLITFHDGVWDEMTTGKGPVASTTKAGLESILLESRKGVLSAERPSLFADMLATAKGNLYLEIDFKSSARESQVIDLINEYGMGDQVILISYEPSQAKRLAKLAPNMLLSIGPDTPMRGQAIWMGGRLATADMSKLDTTSFMLGRVGKKSEVRGLRTYQDRAHVLVSDYANQYRPITGLSQDSEIKYRACLSEL
ncbi:glycerophosphodiester phosphodiesterase family protein [Litorimonas sp. RW-G-Af-16]|uniref:glycerophosphodiester phosphodiesterase family protein n=1 Tax=Litorimonas sp. RW-G-Af-16 TaxID=3241168 RepID=UPI00390CC5C9